MKTVMLICTFALSLAGAQITEQEVKEFLDTMSRAANSQNFEIIEALTTDDFVQETVIKKIGKDEVKTQTKTQYLKTMKTAFETVKSYNYSYVIKRIEILQDSEYGAKSVTVDRQIVTNQKGKLFDVESIQTSFYVEETGELKLAKTQVERKK